jgi:signal transduction histidine kinase
MHGRALSSLSTDHDFPHARNGTSRRAANFFNEILALLRNSRGGKAAVRPNIRKHAVELALGIRKLRREISRRKRTEQGLKESRILHQSLLIQSELMQKKLRDLARPILSAQEDERREISRELHDEVVQTLVGINVQLAILGRAASPGTKALRSKISSTQRLVKKSANAVHQFAHDLRPSVLDDFGLIPALRADMKTVAVREKIRIEFTDVASAEDLSDDKRTVLFRVAHEALVHIEKHAHATIVTVSIFQIQNVNRVGGHEDGRSFNVSQAYPWKTNKWFGLLGMRERVEMVGGKLTIHSSPGHGTTVCADIPRTPPVSKKS